jgi:hypothetical protein
VQHRHHLGVILSVQQLGHEQHRYGADYCSGGQKGRRLQNLEEVMRVLHRANTTATQDGIEP